MAATHSDRPRRDMVFQEGTSHKFWQIELNGSSHTVTFGKVGTNGQTQTKEFDSEDAAVKSYDKLVAEKLKKGYVETSSGAASTPAAAPVTSSAAASKPDSAAKPVKPAPSKKKVEVAAEPAAIEAVPASPVNVANLQVVREIRLNDEDWARATFQRKAPPQRCTPRPFDQTKCLAQLAKLKTESYGWDLRWQDLNLPSGLERMEAHFWLVAMTTNRNYSLTPKLLAANLKSLVPTGELTVSEVTELLDRHDREPPEEVGILLGNLLSTDEILEFWRAGRKKKGQKHLQPRLLFGILHHVVPFWTDDERQSAVALVRQDWDPTLSPADFYLALPENYYLAAALGMHDEISDVVSSWANDRYGSEAWETDHYQRPQELLFGLGSAEQIASEWRRLRLKMRNKSHVRGFLACTQYAALDCVRDSIVAEKNKDRCEELLKAFALVVAPEAAESMLEIKLTSKSPLIARQWLDENLGCAVAGLLETAAGRGKLADAAVDHLRNVKRLGHQDVIQQCLSSTRPEVADKVRQEVLEHQERSYTPFDDASTPAWLRDALLEAGKLKQAKLPTWAVAPGLPPIAVGDHRLNDAQIATVLNTLAGTVITGKHVLFDSLLEHADVRTLDDFAWRLFQYWSEDGSPTKEKWAMGAIGLLGGDNCALKLTPLVRNWPGESQHPRAVFGLECLRAIGSNVALMQLSGIAQKLKFKGLKTKAEEFVEAIAKDKGLTRAELEDRVIPDCGLDENGKREFSFGARSFSFVLGPELKPMVRDADGKVRDDLPKPGARDDAEISKASVDEWKLLKKQIKEVAKIQAGRLEQAMVTGRRWKVDEFEPLMVRHPLMSHLARKIIWGGYDSTGKLLSTFRVTDERDYADTEENPVSLKEASCIGIVHPLHLGEDERSAWGGILGDYEIVPPFAQLGRSVHSLVKGEETADNLDRFKGMKLVAPTLVFGLEKLGWIRGVGMDAGCFDEHSKQFPAADVTAVVQYDGNVGMGWIDPDEILEVSGCQFVRGMRAPSGYGFGKDDRVLKLGDVDPIVVSEVIADLNELKTKAR
ncbi:MAG: DUF4132 domain-containing protein [Planctomycetes bacterium]|nr:DUF4132 domain-containing protein [Planctomycetota bacterium]